MKQVSITFTSDAGLDGVLTDIAAFVATAMQRARGTPVPPVEGLESNTPPAAPASAAPADAAAPKTRTRRVRGPVSTPEPTMPAPAPVEVSSPSGAVSGKSVSIADAQRFQELKKECAAFAETHGKEALFALFEKANLVRLSDLPPEEYPFFQARLRDRDVELSAAKNQAPATDVRSLLDD